MPEQLLAPLDKIRVNTLKMTYETLDSALYALGTLFKKGHYTEEVYNQAEAEISRDMKALSDKVAAITGEPIAVFDI